MESVHDPELIDLLLLHKKDIMNSLNCHAIATIQSYDKKTKTCKATIVYKKSITKRNDKTQTYYEALEDYPILINCPVMNMTGGETGIRFPVKKGDVALILYNDRDIDNWFTGKQSNGAVATKRTHHFSDGVAIVGLFSKNDADKDYQKNKADLDADKTIWYNGTSKIGLSGDNIIVEKGTTKITVGASNIVIEKGAVKITLGTKVKIENGAGTLMTVLNSIFEGFKLLPSTYTTTSPGNPVAPGASTPIVLAGIDSYISTLQGLLE